MKIETIYLDMDGVLTNFNKKYQELYNIDPVSIKQDDWAVRWEDFVMGGHFKELEVLPGADELLEFVWNTGLRVEILSSTGGPDHYELIRQQKLEWLARHNVPLTVNIVPGKKFKTDFAAPNKLLIDDQEGIITKFVLAGGHGIHHKNWETTRHELVNTFGF